MSYPGYGSSIFKCFHLTIFISISAKKVKQTSKLWRELFSAHRRSQVKFQLIQTSYIKRTKLFLFSPYNKHIINRAKSMCMGES